MGPSAGDPTERSLPIEEGEWERLSIGQAIDVVTIPGDDERYVRAGGIHNSIGNLFLDILLFFIEAGVAIYLVWRLLVRGRARAGGGT